MKIVSSMNSEKRFNTQELFNRTDKAVMIASTLAAGEGLNLQSCSDCIIHERQWNPANEEQAEGRFLRIGQTAKQVNGTYPTASGTVDEFLDKIIEKKRIQFHAAMNKGEAPIWKQKDIVNELAASIVEEASKLKKMASW